MQIILKAWFEKAFICKYGSLKQEAYLKAI